MNKFNIRIVENNIISHLQKDLQFESDVTELSYPNLKKFKKTVIVIPKKSLYIDFDYIDINIILNFNKEIILFIPELNIVGYKQPDKFLTIYTYEKLDNQFCEQINKYINDIEQTKQYLEKKNIDLNIDLFTFFKTT